MSFVLLPFGFDICCDLPKLPLSCITFRTCSRNHCDTAPTSQINRAKIGLTPPLVYNELRFSSRVVPAQTKVAWKRRGKIAQKKQRMCKRSDPERDYLRAKWTGPTLLFRMSRYFKFGGSFGLLPIVLSNIRLRAPLYVCLRKPLGEEGSASL